MCHKKTIVVVFLQELIFTGCSRGQLTGRNILLHASMRCKNLTSLDASWSDVDDNGVIAMSEASPGLLDLRLNGCQKVSDEAIVALVNKHGI